MKNAALGFLVSASYVPLTPLRFKTQEHARPTSPLFLSPLTEESNKVYVATSILL